MSQQYLGQIEMFGFGFAPKGWAACNGQTLPINQNQALFSLLGTTYGGNGVSTFQLPNLQSRIPLGFGNGGGGNYVQGETGGEENHTLLYPEMPTHNHTLNANTAATGNANTPASNTSLGVGTNCGSQPSGQPFTISLYTTSSPTGAQYAGSVGNNGSSQPHSNLMPYLVLNFCIALTGVFPTRG